MDDDVQYLGTRLAVQEPLDDLSDIQLLVTGITLHVEKCGDKPAHDLTFYRARSSSVNIGRKSGSDDRTMRRENDDHNAVFTCQVVSARHAKLLLSDSGQVYIVDLHSRHGTHLSKRGETTSRMLQPEVETLLADGDVVTFGKVVGAGSYHVSPITVRVELLTGFSSSEPSADSALTSSHPSSPVLEARPRKLSSGRYGLISASIIESDSPQSSSSISVSSDAASSPSEQESDVEDELSCIPAVLRDSQGKPSVKIPTFRNLIREMCHDTALHSPAISDVPDEPSEDASASPPSADVVIHPSPVVIPEPIPKSRSHSPIDLPVYPPFEAQQSEPAIIGAWPASRPDSPRHSSLEVEAERSEVPLAPEQDRQPEPLPTPPSPCQARVAPHYSASTLLQLVQGMHSHSQTPLFSPFSKSIASDFGFPSVPPPPLPPLPPPPPPPHRMPPFHPLDRVVTHRVNSEIKGSLKSVEDRITALQETISDLKSRQTVTEEDVIDLQSHVEMLEPDSERLLCRITGAERNIATLSTLQSQMAVLQNQVSTLRARVDASEPRPVETPMDDVRACADALNNLVSEMKALREDVEKRIEAKMEAIQSARAEALDALKGVVTEAESMRSSKRKREDEEVAEETPEVVAAVGPIACSPPIVVDEIPLREVSVPQVPFTQAPLSVPNLVVPVPIRVPIPEVPVPEVPVPEVPAPEVPAPEVPTLEPTRPKKRARTAMYMVVHAATAMAVGAAATWSALAFS